jgi:acetylornithine aminotransferase/acetylornithine/N-succinyldiaminopimelate aminotransferase
VAIEFLRQVQGLLKHINALGDYFREKLERLAARHSAIREIRGLGLMLGLEIDQAETAKAAVQQLLDRGILINRTHETVLRFLPPYVIQTKHVDEVIRALDAALSAKPGAAVKSSTRRKH